ncbi:MAG: hypothetical protein EOM12_09555 [Verrucomicrobiae bacterium]|nr:hypothetical protein [Verrucomicrobiae bacterium]
MKINRCICLETEVDNYVGDFAEYWGVSRSAAMTMMVRHFWQSVRAVEAELLQQQNGQDDEAPRPHPMMIAMVEASNGRA